MKRNIFIGFLLGVLAGIIGKAIFEYRVCQRIDEADDFKF